MPKTQNFPIGNDFKAEVIQRNLEDLFIYAHEHGHRITEPTESEGTVGDIVLVKTNNLYYLYVKFIDGWKKVNCIDDEGNVYDDVRVPGSATQNGVSAPDLISFHSSGNLQILAFDGGGTIEQVYFQIQMPHSYKEGSLIYPHVHWTPTTSGSGNVKWNLEYTWVNVNETFPTPVTVTAVQAASGTAWKHQVVGFGSIDGTSKKISSMLVCRLYRNPSDAQDTYGSDAAFLEVDCHYQLDSDGSTQQFIK
jgi:hypothetical protein